MKARVSWFGAHGRVHYEVPAVIDDRQGVFRVVLPKDVPAGADVIVEADIPDVYKRSDRPTTPGAAEAPPHVARADEAAPGMQGRPAH